MLSKKTGFPEEDELVLCTVSTVQYHSVFVKLDEYDRVGLVHISEVAPGRIRNIRDYVKEGKKIVCKVLRVNKEKGHIDLSLRRVNEAQKKQKLNSVKQEQLAEKIIEYAAKSIKESVESVYKKTAEPLLKKFGSLYLAFESVSRGELDLEQFFDKKFAKELKEQIAQRIKPAEVEVEGEMKIQVYDPEGVSIVKEALKKAESAKGSPEVIYKGAGSYRIRIVADEYKKAEKILKEAVDNFLKYAKSKKAEAEFVRVEE